ncbi:MAG: hypothetical protein ABIK96_08955 [bacterium]
MEELRRLEKAQWRPADELADRSHEKLAGMLLFACARVPFHRDFSAQAGLDPDRVGPSDLDAFLLMTKKDLKDRQERFFAEGRNPADRVANATGGSSGPPVGMRNRARGDLENLALPIHEALDCGPERVLTPQDLTSNPLDAKPSR